MITRHLATVAALAAALTLTACGYDPAPQERRSHLEQMYRDGAKTAEAMRAHGIEVTEKTCGDSFVSDGLEDRRVIRDAFGAEQVDENKIWQRQRRTSYVNGCMNRPNDINASPAPSTSSPTKETTP